MDATTSLPPNMPVPLQQALAQLGVCQRPDAVEAVYAPWFGQHGEEEGDTRNLSYGPHPRQVLDVYRPTTTCKPRAAVLLYVHGGGFIRGDKALRRNVGRWGASLGYLTVLMNYRLAPDAQWPCGAEDVALAVSWLKQYLPELAGSTRRLVLVGESAGAAHVAAAALVTRLQPKNWAIAGAALLSGPYDAELEAVAPQALGIAQPDVRNEAYFGADRSGWSAASVVRQIDVPPFPLLIAAAERDLLQMQVQAAHLFATLTLQHGYQPELHWWQHHNHFSPGMSLGSVDTTVARALVAFAERVTASPTL